MKSLLFLLAFICLVMNTNAQFDIHTDTLPNGNITSNGDTLFINVNMAVYDSIKLYIPNWMTTGTFVSPTTTPFTTITSKVLYPQDNGEWIIMDQGGNGDVIFIELTFYNFTGFSKKSIEDFSVYPNPVTNELIIEIQGNKKTVNFEIFNSIGQIVFKGGLLEKTVVNTSSFATGVYFINIENGKTLEFKKIVKE